MIFTVVIDSSSEPSSGLASNCCIYLHHNQLGFIVRQQNTLAILSQLIPVVSVDVLAEG